MGYQSIYAKGFNRLNFNLLSYFKVGSVSVDSYVSTINSSVWWLREGFRVVDSWVDIVSDIYREVELLKEVNSSIENIYAEIDFGKFVDRYVGSYMSDLYAMLDFGVFDEKEFSARVRRFDNLLRGNTYSDSSDCNVCVDSDCIDD